ncbi:universal stress protein [Acinetobacter sp. ANC 3789]
MKAFFDDACRNATDALAKAEKLRINLSTNEVEIRLIKAEVLAQAITKVAEQSKVSLIIMGSHGRKDI